MDVLDNTGVVFNRHRYLLSDPLAQRAL